MRLEAEAHWLADLPPVLLHHIIYQLSPGNKKKIQHFQKRRAIPHTWSILRTVNAKQARTGLWSLIEICSTLSKRFRFNRVSGSRVHQRIRSHQAGTRAYRRNNLNKQSKYEKALTFSLESQVEVPASYLYVGRNGSTSGSWKPTNTWPIDCCSRS